MNATSTNEVSRLIGCTIAFLLLAACSADVERDDRVATSEDALTDDVCPAAVPEILKPAADQRLWFLFAAEGVQIYECRQTATGPAWATVNEGNGEPTQCG